MTFTPPFFKRTFGLKSRQHTRGFSLVELSIVLVILGLLVGGVLSGQALIRAAELRAVPTEYNRYSTAIYSFRDKYFALPGDMANATSFWGDQATGTSSCASASTADGTPGTCNGNSDNIIGGSGTIGAEGMRAWQHLAMAGLIEGSYTGYLDAGNTKITIGVNVPSSKLANAGWGYLYRPSSSPNKVWSTVGNFFLFAGEQANQLWGQNLLTPQEAWNIDVKMDDGIADRGVMLVATSGACVDGGGNNAVVDAADRLYDLDNNTGKTCSAYFSLNN